MTQIAISPSLYELDYALWLEDTVNKLKTGNINGLDLENLIEEIEDLGRSQKHKLRSHLTTLLEHILKRCYVTMPNEFNGWQRTIREQRRQIKWTIESSPSLVRYFVEIFDSAFTDVLAEVKAEPGYKFVTFPDRWPFGRDLESILETDFWQDELTE
jgi:Domain of unknown function DUF29